MTGIKKGEFSIITAKPNSGKSRIIQIIEVHDDLVEALANSSIELSVALDSAQGSTARAMIRLRLEQNALVLLKARGEV